MSCSSNVSCSSTILCQLIDKVDSEEFPSVLHRMKAHQAQTVAAMRDKAEQEPKAIRWDMTKLDFKSPEDLEVHHISREAAVALIQDLAQELAGTGTTRLVLRSGSRFMVFQVDK